MLAIWAVIFASNDLDERRIVELKKAGGKVNAWGVGTRGEVEDFFAGAKQQYNARGIVDTRPDILRLEWLTDRIAVVEVRWPYIDVSGDEIGAESSTYIVRREDDGEYMFRATIMQGEATRH